ncbi:MAG: copper homeostasis protein CutC [Bryobacteraceae bacterium]
MRKTLEVIVTSVHEAREAERGGADRLELVRDLSHEGLTPSPQLIRNVMAAVSIPVRVIVRIRGGFTAANGDIAPLQAQMEEIWRLGVDGIVLGFANANSLDVKSMHDVLKVAPDCRVTFHRAFDEVANPRLALEQLRQIPQVDRVLTSGGAGATDERAGRLNDMQQVAGPRIAILAGGGLDAHSLPGFARQPHLQEFHVGRAARIPAEPLGVVRRSQVALLRSILD